MALLNIAFNRALDANADPVNGGKLYVYDAGTTTPATAYSDDGLTTAHAHPIVADSEGHFPAAYMPEGAYKVVIKDADDNTISERDNVDVFDMARELWSFDTRGAAEVGETGAAGFIRVAGLLFINDDSGTALTTGDGRTWSPAGIATLAHWGVTGTAIGSGEYMATPATDESTAIQAAMDWCLANGVDLVCDKSRVYGISSPVVWGANGAVVPVGQPALVDFQFVWIGSADTATTKTADDPDDWSFTNGAALTVGGADGSTAGKYTCSVRGLRGDGQRIKNVVHFRQLDHANLHYWAERGLDYEVRIGEENDDSLNCTNCDFDPTSLARHYAYQERSDGTFDTDDGSGWWGATGRTSVGHLIESSDVQLSVTGNTGLHSFVLRGGSNVYMDGCKWWNGPGAGNPYDTITGIITKTPDNYALRDSSIQDGALEVYGDRGVISDNRFSQFDTDPIRFIASNAGETFARLTFTGNMAGFSDPSIALQEIGSGTWAYMDATFHSNTTWTGDDLTIQSRTSNINGIPEPVLTQGALEYYVGLGYAPPDGTTHRIGLYDYQRADGDTSLGANLLGWKILQDQSIRPTTEKVLLFSDPQPDANPDTGSDDQVAAWRSILAGMVLHHSTSAWAILAGDVVDRGVVAFAEEESNANDAYTYEDMRDDLADLPMGIHNIKAISGNHDPNYKAVKQDPEGNSFAEFLRWFPSQNYFVKRGNHVVIFMSDMHDDTSGRITDYTVDWWERVVRAHQGCVIGVVTHQSIGDQTQPGNTINDADLTAEVRITESDRFTDLMAAGLRVDYWLSGHHARAQVANEGYRTKVLHGCTFINVALNLPGNLEDDPDGDLTYWTMHLTDGSDTITFKHWNHDDAEYISGQDITVTAGVPVQLSSAFEFDGSYQFNPRFDYLTQPLQVVTEYESVWNAQHEFDPSSAVDNTSHGCGDVSGQRRPRSDARAVS